MRRSTIILTSVLAVMVLLAGVFWMGGTLSARMEAVTAGAADYPEAFESIKSVVEAGAAPQELGEPLPEEASLCRLEDVTLSLYNPGLISAEWVSVTVEAAPGDVAVYSLTGEGDTIPGRSTGTLNLKLIARSDAPDARTYRVEYYVFGVKRTLRVRRVES